MEKYLLIYGNPVDGFSYTGPFDSAEDANAYADRDRLIRSTDWWCGSICVPEKTEGENENHSAGCGEGDSDPLRQEGRKEPSEKSVA